MAIRPSTPTILGPAIADHLADLIPRAQAAEGKAELGAYAEEICIHYRALGICVLSDEADPTVFFQWLIHSGLTWRHYLSTVGAKGEPRFLRASFVDPVLDAMAAHQWKLAADIAKRSAQEWLEGQEYEDDFCYGDFLRRVCTGGEAGMAKLLSRWEGVLEGAIDRRLSVAQAFAAKDADAFEESLRSLLEESERQAMEMADPEGGSVLSSDYPFFPNRWISVEGLAWLAAAERHGLTAAYDLEGCPRIARSPGKLTFRPVAYPMKNLD